MDLKLSVVSLGVTRGWAYKLKKNYLALYWYPTNYRKDFVSLEAIVMMIVILVIAAATNDVINNVNCHQLSTMEALRTSTRVQHSG